MTIIAIINNKGGVGKTTTAINLGAALARLGRRVLLVDLDDQGNLTDSLGISLTPALPPRHVGAFLLSELPEAASWHFTPVEPNLWVLPSHDQLGADLAQLQEQADYETRLGERLTMLDLGRYRFDYVLLDCSPSFTDGTAFSAFTAANAYLLPTDVEPSSVRGIARVRKLTAKMAEARNPGLGFAGFVFTRFNQARRGALKKHLAADITAAYGLESVLGHVRQDVALTEAQLARQSVFAYAPGSRGAADHTALALALISRLTAPLAP